MFFILFILAGRAYRIGSVSFGIKEKLVLFAICSSYGILLEIMQDLVFIERSFDKYDAIANSFGAMMAGFLFRK